MLAGYLFQTACELREGKALLNLFEVRQKLEMRRRDMKWANQLEKMGRKNGNDQ